VPVRLGQRYFDGNPQTGKSPALALPWTTVGANPGQTMVSKDLHGSAGELPKLIVVRRALESA
jgi:hypothetical protein